MDRAASIRPKAVQSLAIGFLVALAACTIEIGPPSVPRPDVVYEPDIAGPVSDGECDRATDTCTLTVGGETFEIGPNAHALYGEGRGGSDTLLLYGSDGGMEWYASISIASTEPWAGCAILATPDAWDAGDSILFAFTLEDDSVIGMQLPKAIAWDHSIQPQEDGRYPPPYTDWCIDMDGRVERVFEGHGG
jgi:hypothetical protein